MAKAVTKQRFGNSVVDEQHQDFQILARIRAEVERKAGGGDRLRLELPNLIKNAVDFVIDPVRTGRTSMEELDKVEKTFIGLKVEHFLRDWLDVPKGLHRDLQIDGLEVDIKNTIGTTWMIPLETYRDEEPCLLIATAKFDGRCWLGLVVAREAYLGGENRDRKRSITEAGRRNILWLVEDVPYPPSRWAGINMTRFRALRCIKGGQKRAAPFFRENVGRVVHRSILEALLHDQYDYMKRVRGNGGARDDLEPEGIAVLSGVYDRDKAEALGICLAKDEFVAVRIAFF
ncbi:MAG: NaeI family type II restriction endonuclease [Hyphomicrobiaceae bacterium]